MEKITLELYLPERMERSDQNGLVIRSLRLQGTAAVQTAGGRLSSPNDQHFVDGKGDIQLNLNQLTAEAQARFKTGTKYVVTIEEKAAASTVAAK